MQYTVESTVHRLVVTFRLIIRRKPSGAFKFYRPH